MGSETHIIVADDDEDLRDAVARALEQLGATVVKVGSGGELIEKMADASFDLVVTDVSMPWMSGLQAMGTARRAGIVTPVIVITALRDERLPERVGALGHSTALLRKPFDLQTLQELAETMLARGRRS